MNALLVLAFGVGRVLRELFSGAPGEIRTPDLLIRSQSLYPTELRAQPHRAFHYTDEKIQPGAQRLSS
jgi:hypothetical protein